MEFSLVEPKGKLPNSRNNGRVSNVGVLRDERQPMDFRGGRDEAVELIAMG